MKKTFLFTHSNAKKRPQVTTIRPSVRGRTPLCLLRMIRPSQKNLFFPGNTSHFLRGRCSALFPPGCSADDTDSARGSICWYSQFFIVETVSILFGGSERHTQNSFLDAFWRDDPLKFQSLYVDIFCLFRSVAHSGS